MLERFHWTIKTSAIRLAAPSTLYDARSVVARFVGHYNNVRLHSAIGYVTPADFMAGRAEAVWSARDQKLQAARDRRRERRAARRAAEAA